MTSNWYYKQGSMVVGPISLAELRKHYAIGGIHPETLVRAGEDGKWTKAESIQGLLTSSVGHSSQQISAATSMDLPNEIDDLIAGWGESSSFPTNERSEAPTSSSPAAPKKASLTEALHVPTLNRRPPAVPTNPKRPVKSDKHQPTKDFSNEWSWLGAFGCIVFAGVGIAVFSKALTVWITDSNHTNGHSFQIVASSYEAVQRQQPLPNTTTEFSTEAKTLLDEAKQLIDSNQVEGAIRLLQKCVTDPHNTEKDKASWLLDEVAIATADPLTRKILSDMSDEEFGRVKAGGEIRDGRITYPALRTVRNDTVRRNLGQEIQRREEIRLAEEKRLEAERLAAIERQRQEEERRRQAEEMAKLAAEQRKAQEEWNKYALTATEKREVAGLLLMKFGASKPEPKTDADRERYEQEFKALFEQLSNLVISRKQAARRLSLSDNEVATIVSPALIKDPAKLRETLADLELRRIEKGKTLAEQLEYLRDRSNPIEIKHAEEIAIAIINYRFPNRNPLALTGEQAIAGAETCTAYLRMCYIEKKKKQVQNLTEQDLKTISAKLAIFEQRREDILDALEAFKARENL